jgi:hypothetical protein
MFRYIDLLIHHQYHQKTTMRSRTVHWLQSCKVGTVPIEETYTPTWTPHYKLSNSTQFFMSSQDSWHTMCDQTGNHFQCCWIICSWTVEMLHCLFIWAVTVLGLSIYWFKEHQFWELSFEVILLSPNQIENLNYSKYPNHVFYTLKPEEQHHQRIN